MAITLELYEDTGPLLAGRGTTTTLADSIGWKDDGSDETNAYVFYPLKRPISPVTETYSYTKYNFIKVSGTYPRATRLRFTLGGNYTGAAPSGYVDCSGKVKIYYKITNVYNPPANTAPSGMVYLPPGVIVDIIPYISLIGPNDATSLLPLDLLTNTNYWTGYLVTQLVVEPGAWDEYGNIGVCNFTCYLDEYESTDL